MNIGSASPASPPVERQLATDMLRRGLPAAPVLVAGAWLGWGVNGALSALCGFAMALANFALAAALMSWGGRRSVGSLMGAAVFGYLLRMVLVVAALAGLTELAWVELLPLGLTLVVTHVGLLWWETRHLSLSLAFPGVKPEQGA